MQTSRTLVLDARALIGRIMKRRLMTYILKTTCCCLWALHHANMEAIGFRRGPCLTLRLGSPPFEMSLPGVTTLTEKTTSYSGCIYFLWWHFKILQFSENLVFFFAAWIRQFLWRIMLAWILSSLMLVQTRKTRHQRETQLLPEMKEASLHLPKALYLAR